MKSLVKNIIIIGGVLLLCFCNKPPEYSTIPYIEFREVTVKRTGDPLNPTDCTYVKIFFRDGDGNLGVNANNPSDQAIIAKCDSSNYVLDVLIKENKEFVPLVFPTKYFTYKKSLFPILYKTTEKSPLEGELTFKGIGFFPTTETIPNLIGNDTIKFRVKIKDRDCNQSNTVESYEVVVNKY